MRTALLLAVITVATAVIWWRLHQLEGTIVATKDEILTQIADVKAVLVETGKDVGRVADKLDAAVAGNDLTAVADAVAELKTIAQGIDDRAESADPEPTPEP